MNEVSPSTPDPMTWISEGVNDLGAYLALWSNRGDQVTAAERAAASEAVERIDVTLRRLHELRSDLVTEIRAADDETARRTDELLEQLRAERGGVTPLPDDGTAWERHDDPEAGR